MTEQAQRIAIATACGWTNCRLGGYGAGGCVERPRKTVGTPPGRKYTCELPNYTKSLDAMHEAEKVLWDQYARGLNSDWLYYDLQLKVVTEAHAGRGNYYTSKL